MSAVESGITPSPDGTGGGSEISGKRLFEQLIQSKAIIIEGGYIRPMVDLETVGNDDVRAALASLEKTHGIQKSQSSHPPTLETIWDQLDRS